MLAASLTFTSSAGAALDEVNTKKLREGVTVNGILQHERAFQQIANINDGTRASGTPGYDASLAYVRERLKKAGYKVTEQEFTFPFFRELAPAELEQVSPTPTDYETATYDYSGTGTVEKPLQEVNDNVFPATPEPSSNAGCEAADFAGFTRGNIALIQRGSCDFAVKVANAEAAGASAVIIFNEGNPGRTDVFAGTLGGEAHVPVVGLSYADALALHNQLRSSTTPVVMKVTTSTENIPNAKTKNLLADSKQGDASQVVVVGAHLDSVAAGPGINDNGSGTAGILEIAEEMAEQKVKPRRQVRFAFWGAEESGLLDSLGPNGVGNIYANLNFDMIGSPNYVRFVYDGDGVPTGTAGPPGSAQIDGSHSSRSGPGQRSDGVRRPLRLRPVHRGRLRRRPLHRGRGRQDRRPGGQVRRHCRRAVRPVLPRGLRRHHEPQHRGAERDVRRRRTRHADAREVQERLLRGRQPRRQAAEERQELRAARPRAPLVLRACGGRCGRRTPRFYAGDTSRSPPNSHA